MMKIVFASYNNQPDYFIARDWLARICKLAALMEAMATHGPVSFIQHIGNADRFALHGVEYHFLHCTKKNKYRFPIRMNKAIRDLQPRVVIVSGLRFPLQVIQLRSMLGKKVKIIARHHADKTPTGLKKLLQRYADRCINAYLFTALGNAEDWIRSGIIKDSQKIYELPAASAEFSRIDKEESRKRTGMSGSFNFLWVGRLNANKDPLTVLSGFEKYLSIQTNARLYMIFQEDDLLREVKQRIIQSHLLNTAVSLVGKVAYELLPAWYSAADFFISGSHSEGGSYALLEAMACGCIPVVTAIPAALKVIAEGKYGIVFRQGNPNDLAVKLSGLSLIDRYELSTSIEKYFHEELSTSAIARKLYGYCNDLHV
jgi:glycosyltransferase involved in cell wall biosynthesis